MPKQLERHLKAQADHFIRSGKLKPKKGETAKEAKNRFTYGIMRKTGWKPNRER